MSKDNSFDIGSKTDLNEVRNAVHQTMKEVQQRFDFKGSKSDIQLEAFDLILTSEDEFRLRSLTEILEQKLVKRSVSLKALTFGKVQQAAGNTVRQTVSIQQGIPIEKAREITKFIRDTKLKAQASIQADVVRVSSRDRDILQKIIGLLKEKDFGIDVQFTNYRTF
ncbi:MAG: YajQ family cyclic di-GMP-binding protein [Acidobacteria bacterium]|nr:MAG: YajQ family cyclic di-GMP-binding protein [Acidobacteriota bacterium]